MEADTANVNPEEINALFYRPRQLAKLMGVHYTTVYSWLRSGELTAKKKRNTTLISREAVIAMVNRWDDYGDTIRRAV